MFFGHSAHKHNSYVVKILAIARFDLFCDNWREKEKRRGPLSHRILTAESAACHIKQSSSSDSCGRFFGRLWQLQKHLVLQFPSWHPYCLQKRPWRLFDVFPGKTKNRLFLDFCCSLSTRVTIVDTQQRCNWWDLHLQFYLFSMYVRRLYLDVNVCEWASDMKSEILCASIRMEKHTIQPTYYSL